MFIYKYIYSVADIYIPSIRMKQRRSWSSSIKGVVIQNWWACVLTIASSWRVWDVFLPSLDAHSFFYLHPLRDAHASGVVQNDFKVISTLRPFLRIISATISLSRTSFTHILPSIHRVLFWFQVQLKNNLLIVYTTYIVFNSSENNTYKQTNK